MSNLAHRMTRLPQTHPRLTMTLLTAAASFALGVMGANYWNALKARRKRSLDRENAGAAREYNGCSFFYGDEKALTTVGKSTAHLPDNLYGQLVRFSVVACVECLVVRINKLTDKPEIIVIERDDEPNKGTFCLPGGRIFKGETFFTAALRKCKSETGLIGNAIQVLGTYNTFFPTSAWDTEGHKGTQCINTVVYVEVADGSEVLLDKTSARYRWIPLDAEIAREKEEDKLVIDAMLRLAAWKGNFTR